MRAKKEIIKLDATMVDVIKFSVFVSELSNGHRIVAFERGRGDSGKRRAASLRIGGHVRVEMSPGDLTTGRIVRSYGKGKGSG